MKVVFVGPTLHGISPSRFPSLVFRPPARCGDVVRAVHDGARIIGLIDGVFERVPSVWHKEILYALDSGVAVLGAASMGALRAAECDAFGMIGIGTVYNAYACGALEDDEEVAQLHGPAELGHLPLSEPLVNVRATLDHLLATAQLSAKECHSLLASAKGLFFKERTYRRILEGSGLSREREDELAVLLKHTAINLKQQDAELLLSMVENDEIPVASEKGKKDWRLARTRSFSELLQRSCSS